MLLYYTIVFFMVGLIMGSFFGVVGTRLSEGKSIVKPGSYCTFCNHKLKWYELIPVFSYLIQGGRCRKCKKKLSIFYPIVELITAILFSVCYYTFDFTTELFIALIIASFLVIVIVSDINYLIIPDEVTIFFSILTIILKFCFYGVNKTFFSILSGILMFCLMYCIMMLGNKIFKKESMGGADIKLMFFIGLILSPSLSIFNIFVSSVIALPVSLISLYKNKDNVIPFGPFLLMGTLLIYFFL